jgi:hypothetical protein
MRESDIKLTDILLETVYDLLYGTPSGNVSPLEPHELLLCVEYFPLLDYKLRLVHVRATVPILVHSVSLLINESLIIVVKVVIRL